MRNISSEVIDTMDTANNFKNAKIVTADNAAGAYRIARELAGYDDIIVISGSFYLAGEFSENFKK